MIEEAEKMIEAGRKSLAAAMSEIIMWRLENPYWYWGLTSEDWAEMKLAEESCKKANCGFFHKCLNNETVVSTKPNSS